MVKVSLAVPDTGINSNERWVALEMVIAPKPYESVRSGNASAILQSRNHESVL